MGYLDFYQLSAEERLVIFKSISKEQGLPDFAVEKDWWVVRTLAVVFQTEVGAHTVFKGGTSLSKAWGLIERFSEDVDLALDRSFFGFDIDKPTRTQIGKLRKASKKYIVEVLVPQIEEGFKNAGLSNVAVQAIISEESDQDPLLIEVNYPNITEASAYVKPRVIVEIGSRSLKEPFTNCTIRSLVGEIYEDEKWADESIEIPVVNPERTFLEKLFLLHEEFQRPKEKMRVYRLSRHLYDIHQIAKTEFGNVALADKELYAGIVAHRKVFTKVGGVDYQSHFPPNLNPIPSNELLEAWKKDYAIMQEQMIYGESPSFQEIIESIETIVRSINES